MALSGEAFVREIQRMVERKHSKDHPVIAAIEAGELSKKQLKGFIGQFYLYFPKPFPKPIAAMLGRCPEDPELEHMWIDNVMEEATGAGTKTGGHKDLYQRFAVACGYSEEELNAVAPLPETKAFLAWRELLINQRSWLELYAGQGFCLEGTAAPRMTRIVNGLVNHYGFDRKSRDIEYWTVHMSVDEEHMRVGPYAVAKYAVSDFDQERVRQAVQQTLDIFWLALDGVKRAFVDEDPLYADWRRTL
ncbi:MAG TPA: iron-containing redox enzyme family protein [Candidatus Binataceae bacterium]|nr:iron-containing redox enzyme family protein [Candidatus Binataceae bacterium]